MTCPAYSKHVFDVVVIGGGAAGALAAIQAKHSGVTVAFLTKESALVGGATVMAGGGTSVVLTKEDSSETFYNDILKSGQYINNRKLVRMVAEHAKTALYDLENCDFLLDRKDLARNGSESVHAYKQGEGHSHPRAYLDRREALGFCHGISKSIMRNKIDLFTETIAVKILTLDNQVTGVIAYSLITGEFLVFQCKSVVLAAGGLGALYEETTNSTVLAGTGYALGYDAGSRLVDMEMVQFMPLTFPYPKIRRGKIIGMCSLLGPAVKLYNGQGERYMWKYDPVRKEFTTRDIGARANYTEIKEGRGTPNRTIVVDNRDYDPQILERWKTTSPFRYRQCCQAFGPEAGNWEKPFEAIPSQHFFMGGVKIDEHFATDVSGLFAVGEVSGGIHGANRLSGVAFAEIFGLGPLAGEEASAYAKSSGFSAWDQKYAEDELSKVNEPLTHAGEGARPYQIKQKIQKIMSGKLGPVREGKELELAIRELEQIQAELPTSMVVTQGDVRYNRERLDALEVPLMLKTALMVARSAYARTESRGSHFRTDFPEKDENWVKNVCVRKDAEGMMQICSIPVEQEIGQ